MPCRKVVSDPQAELVQEIAIRGNQRDPVYRKVVPDPQAEELDGALDVVDVAEGHHRIRVEGEPGEGGHQ